MPDNTEVEIRCKLIANGDMSRRRCSYKGSENLNFDLISINYEKKMKAPHIVCYTLFRNQAHYLGMHTIKEGTLNAVNTVAAHQRLQCKRSKRNCPDISSVLAIWKHGYQGIYDWHLCKVDGVNNRAEMRVLVEYYDGEPLRALKLHEEEWGIISCPEKRTAPSREWSAAYRFVKSMKQEATQDNLNHAKLGDE